MRKLLCLLLGICASTTINAQSWQTVFYDDFNRADSALGANYSTTSSGDISQLGIVSNEVKVTSGDSSPAYWTVDYANDVNYDSIRISCVFKAPHKGYGFSLNARDDGHQHTYSAGIISQTDSIFISLRDYSGNSTTLAGAKASFDTTKTYFLEFTLKHSDLTFKCVEVGMTDTIGINATDNSLTGNKVNISGYYYASNVTVFFDNLKIESYNNSTGINNVPKSSSSPLPHLFYDFGKLTIDQAYNSDLKINIYNSLGKIARSETIIENHQQINTANLSKGLYIVEIKAKEFAEKQKLIIQR